MCKRCIPVHVSGHWHLRLVVTQGRADVHKQVTCGYAET